MATKPLTKHLAIDKANAQMVAAVSIASFVAVFCLVASQAVWSQNRYESKVASTKEKARKQLIDNLDAFNDLVSSYKQFDSKNPNYLGGQIGGTGDNDGTNSKLVLDALPSTYDFPALTSSIEKILTDRNLKVGGISGTDDQLNQESVTSSSTPQAVEMPFAFSVSNASFDSAKKLILALEQSIRPLQVDMLNISGSNDNMTVNVTAHTYYQPAKTVNITKKVVK